MMSTKTNDLLDCYFETMGISDKKIITYIKNGISNRINKYSNFFDTISLSDDNYQNYPIKSEDGHYTLEDFLLNRLFQGLRNITFRKDTSTTSCEYTPKNRTIYFSQEMITKNILTKIEKFPNELKSMFVDIILATVFDHELGHALKTQFQGGYKLRADNLQKMQETLLSILQSSLGNEKALDIFSSLSSNKVMSSDDLYIKLLENLSTIKNGQYASMILNPNELIDAYSYDIGTGIDKNNNTKEKKLTYLDEILQEVESMDNNEFYEIPQAKINIGNNGNYINAFHLFSGYNPILGYGKALALLLGIEDTFRATYLNPSPIFNKFNNKYKDISQEIFQNDLSPITNINESLNKIISTKDEEEYLRLDLFIAKCYELKINTIISKNTNEDKDKIMKDIESIQQRLTINDNQNINDNLPHNRIFNRLKLKFKQSTPRKQ